jgi:hypothetical protein
MTTVFEDHANLVGLHALIIGIGNYDPGVQEQVSLDAAVPSASAVAKWLYAEYNNPNTPLRSLEVILAPPGNAGNTTPLVLPPAPTRAELTVHVEDGRYGAIAEPPDPGRGVAGAIERWFNRANRHADNLTLLYLCGHGAEIKGDQHFFCQQFDTTNAAMALTRAVNLRKLVAGMETCLARKQFFLFDCCRDRPSWGAGFNDTASAPIVANIDALPPGTAPLQIATIYAATAGGRAGADEPALSRFAKALLEVVRGPACDPNRGGGVSSRNIVTAIEDLLEARVLPDWGGQIPKIEQGDRFEFHRPVKPKVPVVLEAAVANGEQIQVDGQPCTPIDMARWVAWCGLGTHSAAVVADNGNVLRSRDVMVGPTYTRGEL